MSRNNKRMHEILQTVVKDLDQFSLTLHSPNKKGDGYSAEMYFVNLKDKHCDKEFEFAIKIGFSDEMIRKAFPVRNLYMNEVHFLSKIWPKLEQFQSEYIQNPFDKIVKCLASDSTVNLEFIVMDNLKFQGFDVFDKTTPLDRQHMEFVMKQYGIFHAFSLAFKALHPEEYSEFSKILIDVHSGFCGKDKPNESKTFHEFGMKSLQPGRDSKVIENYSRYIENGAEIINEGISYHGKHSVILHGDCWSNNMMFKYDENQQLIDMRFIDFQMSKDGNPVTDLSYCFYSSGSKELLDDLNHYLEKYHQSLSQTLASFGCEPDKIYSFQELKDDWKRYCKFGFMMGLILWKAKLTYAGDAIDLTDRSDDGEENNDLTKKYFDAKYDEEEYRKRTRDLIVHMHENDYL